MRYERTPQFDSDFKALRREHRKQFLASVPTFAGACEGYAADPARHVWPVSLRVARMLGATGVWEMTWSFASPDGQATFEFIRVGTEAGDEVRLRWRRIGDHGIYRDP